VERKDGSKRKKCKAKGPGNEAICDELEKCTNVIYQLLDRLEPLAEADSN